MRLLIGGSPTKMFHLKEFANALTNLGVDCKLVVDVFKNEEKYPYLIKQYDSIEYGYTYHIKIFKIDYKIFENAMLIKIE